ncbi:MAG: NAD-dependent epimerase/dehydratase family protein [Chloroflexi bacterium]|nr:MAG: NAD-dependent epimerase/dehydratase family protein [Chloroflexota bacterium]
MHVVVIGGTGHIGTYLIPRLVAMQMQVTVVSRRASHNYGDHPAWQQVNYVQIDRTAAEASGMFGEQIRALKPDVVIDLICFTLESAQHLAEALQGHIQHFLHCGTMWVHGHSTKVPATEDLPRNPFCDYGRKKAAVEAYLLQKARRQHFPATILHPGHIVGEGWMPINPAGNLNPAVFEKLASGKKLALPNIGMETLHHVHADDVAQAFIKAMQHWGTAIGESFHVVSPAALTLRGYAEAVARWFGKEAQLEFLPWEMWKAQASEEDAAATWDHIAHSPNGNIEKARRLLQYEPRYTSLQAIYEAVQWLIAHEKLKIVQ